MPPAMPLRALGRSGVRVPVVGAGTNRWGAPGKGADALSPIFDAALDAGANLDTAEVYQFGGSEKALGECMRRDPRAVFIVDKFAPYPTRFSSKSLLTALEASLARLGTRAILAEATRAGKVRAVGVSNFSAQQMYAAAKRLERHGLPLAANEVHYNVWPTNGVIPRANETVCSRRFENGCWPIQNGRSVLGATDNRLGRAGNQ